MENARLVTSLLAALAIYFIPAVIGWNKRNSVAIFWLNLLLGWTVLGWIGAFIWALTNDAPVPAAPAPPAPVQPTGPGLTTEKLARLQQLRDQGAITQEEYIQQLLQG